MSASVASTPFAISGAPPFLKPDEKPNAIPAVRSGSRRHRHRSSECGRISGQSARSRRFRQRDSTPQVMRSSAAIPLLRSKACGDSSACPGVNIRAMNRFRMPTSFPGTVSHPAGVPAFPSTMNGGAKPASGGRASSFFRCSRSSTGAGFIPDQAGFRLPGSHPCRRGR